jgi:ketosteroid isomerase-like protein
MPEDSTTPDLVELTRRSLETGPKEIDVGMRFFACDAVWEVPALGTRLEGVGAIRSFFEDWLAAFGEFEIDLQKVLDMGNGVVLTLAQSRATLLGGAERIPLQEVFVYVTVWIEGEISRVTVYTDIAEARAAAERLAEERG